MPKNPPAVETKTRQAKKKKTSQYVRPTKELNPTLSNMTDSPY